MKVGTTVKFSGKRWVITKVSPGGGMLTLVGPHDTSAPIVKVVHARYVEPA